MGFETQFARNRMHIDFIFKPIQKTQRRNTEERPHTRSWERMWRMMLMAINYLSAYKVVKHKSREKRISQNRPKYNIITEMDRPLSKSYLVC